MKSISTRELVPGMVVAREVTSPSGVILLERGIRLTAAQIANLQVWDVPSIMIDEAAPPMEQPISMNRDHFLKEYMSTLGAVKETFDGIRQFRRVPVAKLESLVDQTVVLLVNTVGVLYYMYEVREHNDYTFQHSVNVAVVSGVVGKWLGIDEQTQKSLILTGLLHDIGKLFIPLPILEKPTKLSLSEYEEIKKHPEEGHQLVKSMAEVSRDVKMGILQHHERLDGSGYPFGFRGDEIHPFAKIVAIADMYDAMTSDRTYRKRLTPLSAAETIAEQMYNELDTGVCMNFLGNMRNYFTGTRVLLSNGQHAKIIMLDRAWTKPLVQTEEGTVLDLGREKLTIVDLEAE